MYIKNATQNTQVAYRAREARSFWAKLKGLIGQRCFEAGEALSLRRCRAIHMFGMKFPIDAIFLDKDMQVLRLVRNLMPGSISPFVYRAYTTIELPIGTIDQTKSKEGDQLIIV